MHIDLSQKGDTTILHLKGQLNFESADQIKKNFLDRLINRKVILDFKELIFVGSSGINIFFSAIKDFSNRSSYTPKLSSVANDFKRIIEVTQLCDLELFEDIIKACDAFDKPFEIQYDLLKPKFSIDN